MIRYITNNSMGLCQTKEIDIFRKHKKFDTLTPCMCQNIFANNKSICIEIPDEFKTDEMWIYEMTQFVHTHRSRAITHLFNIPSRYKCEENLILYFQNNYTRYFEDFEIFFCNVKNSHQITPRLIVQILEMCDVSRFNVLKYAGKYGQTTFGVQSDVVEWLNWLPDSEDIFTRDMISAILSVDARLQYKISNVVLKKYGFI
jgi:hypothetical protein